MGISILLPMTSLLLPMTSILLPMTSLLLPMTSLLLPMTSLIFPWRHYYFPWRHYSFPCCVMDITALLPITHYPDIVCPFTLSRHVRSTRPLPGDFTRCVDRISSTYSTPMNGECLWLEIRYPIPHTPYPIPHTSQAHMAWCYCLTWPSYGLWTTSSGSCPKYRLTFRYSFWLVLP